MISSHRSGVTIAKSLSENQYLSKDELSTSQMKESEIILHLLLPPNEETARAIEPGMASFHYPPTSSIARSDLFLSFLFPSTADVGLIVACDQFLVDRSGVVSSIQTAVLWLLWSWLRAADHQPVEGGTEQTDIMTIGSIHNQRQRDSCPIGQQATLGSLFAAISGVGSGRGAGERGFRHHAIHRLPLPLDALQVIILAQPGLPDCLEKARSFPFLKAIMH